MTRRSMIRSIAILAVLGLGASQAKADFNGSFPVAGFNTTASGGAIGTATTFTFSSFVVTANGQLGFSTITAGTSFGTVTPLVLGGTGFSFTDGAAGGFTETAAPVVGQTTIINGVVVAKSFYILGTYVGGPVGATPIAASFTISFTQDGGPGTSISSSGTVTIPPAGVPEPASMTLMGLGLVGAGAIARRRKAAVTS